MTMEEIDRRRDKLGARRSDLKGSRAALAQAQAEVETKLWQGEPPSQAVADSWQRWASAEEMDEYHVGQAEAAVEAALREWWAQGCREVSPRLQGILTSLTPAERDAFAARFNNG